MKEIKLSIETVMLCLSMLPDKIQEDVMFKNAWDILKGILNSLQVKE